MPKAVLLHPRVMAWPGGRTGRGAGIAAWQSAERLEGSGGSSRVEIGRLLTAAIAWFLEVAGVVSAIDLLHLRGGRN